MSIKEEVLKEIEKNWFLNEVSKRNVKLAIDLTQQKMIEDEIKWLQSVLDTRHIAEESRWIIEGRIEKLKELKSQVEKT